MEFRALRALSACNSRLGGFQQLLREQRGEARGPELEGASEMNALLEAPELPGDPIRLPFFSSACPPEFVAPLSQRRFLRLQQIGAGMMSTVHLAVDTMTKSKVALKMYLLSSLSPALLKSVKAEVAIQGRLRHPHILPLWAAFEDGKHLCIVSKYAEGTDLFRRRSAVRRDEPAVVKHIVGPLLSAISSMHLAGIVHRDIKPENVLLEGSHAFLSDFGFSVSLRHQRPVTRLGTLVFMAPEILVAYPDGEGKDSGAGVMRRDAKRDARAPYDEGVDVWALGVLTVECLTGHAPFHGESDEDVLRSIEGGWEMGGSVSPNAADFVRKCLTVDARNRPDALDLYRHPWIRGNMPAKLYGYLDPTRWMQGAADPTPMTSPSPTSSNHTTPTFPRPDSFAIAALPTSPLPSLHPLAAALRVAPSPASSTVVSAHSAAPRRPRIFSTRQSRHPGNPGTPTRASAALRDPSLGLSAHSATLSATAATGSLAPRTDDERDTFAARMRAQGRVGVPDSARVREAGGKSRSFARGLGEEGAWGAYDEGRTGHNPMGVAPMWAGEDTIGDGYGAVAITGGKGKRMSRWLDALLCLGGAHQGRCL